jgi:hypothetical protein
MTARASQRFESSKTNLTDTSDASLSVDHERILMTSYSLKKLFSYRQAKPSGFLTEKLIRKTAKQHANSRHSVALAD